MDRMGHDKSGPYNSTKPFAHLTRRAFHCDFSIGPRRSDLAPLRVTALKHHHIRVSFLDGLQRRFGGFLAFAAATVDHDGGVLVGWKLLRRHERRAVDVAGL